MTTRDDIIYAIIKTLATYPDKTQTYFNRPLVVGDCYPLANHIYDALLQDGFNIVKEQNERLNLNG